MGPEVDERMEVLDLILRISVEQRKLFMENRLDELLKLQKRREDLLDGLNGKNDFSEEPFKGLVAKILDNDRALQLGLESSLVDVREKLKKIRSGFKAIKAYS